MYPPWLPPTTVRSSSQAQPLQVRRVAGDGEGQTCRRLWLGGMVSPWRGKLMMSCSGHRSRSLAIGVSTGRETQLQLTGHLQLREA